MVNITDSYDLVFRALSSIRKHGITNPVEQRATLHKMAQASPELANQLVNFEKSLIKQAAGGMDRFGLPEGDKSLDFLREEYKANNTSAYSWPKIVHPSWKRVDGEFTPVFDTSGLGMDPDELEEALRSGQVQLELRPPNFMENIKNIYGAAGDTVKDIANTVSEKARDAYGAVSDAVTPAINKYKDVSHNIGDRVGTFYANNKGKILAGGAGGLALLAALAYLLRRRGRNKDEEKTASYLRPLLEDKDLVAAINTCDGPAKALALCHELGIESETKIAAVLVSASEPEELAKFAAILN